MQLRDKASAEQLWCKRTFSCFSLFTTKYKEFLHAAVIYRERQHLYLVVSWAGCCVLGWGLTSCGGGGGLGVMDGAWVVLERLSWETNRTRAGWTTEEKPLTLIVVLCAVTFIRSDWPELFLPYTACCGPGWPSAWPGYWPGWPICWCGAPDVSILAPPCSIE